MVYLAVLALEFHQAVQHYKLDVVVRLTDQQLAVAVGGGAHGSRCIGQAHQRHRTLVHHRCAGRLRKKTLKRVELPALVGTVNNRNEVLGTYVTYLFRTSAQLPYTVFHKAERDASCP